MCSLYLFFFIDILIVIILPPLLCVVIISPFSLLHTAQTAVYFSILPLMNLWFAFRFECLEKLLWTFLCTSLDYCVCCNSEVYINGSGIRDTSFQFNNVMLLSKVCQFIFSLSVHESFICSKTLETLGNFSLYFFFYSGRPEVIIHEF